MTGSTRWLFITDTYLRPHHHRPPKAELVPELPRHASLLLSMDCRCTAAHSKSPCHSSL